MFPSFHQSSFTIVLSDLFIDLHVRQPIATIVHSYPSISPVSPLFILTSFIVLHVRQPSATIVHSDPFISSTLPLFVLTSFIVLHVRASAMCPHCSFQPPSLLYKVLRLSFTTVHSDPFHCSTRSSAQRYYIRVCVVRPSRDPRQRLGLSGPV